MAGADPADNLAVFRAFGLDRPDPPPMGAEAVEETQEEAEEEEETLEEDHQCLDPEEQDE